MSWTTTRRWVAGRRGEYRLGECCSSLLSMEGTNIIVRANDCVNGQVDCLQLMRDDQGKMGSKR